MAMSRGIGRVTRLDKQVDIRHQTASTATETIELPNIKIPTCDEPTTTARQKGDKTRKNLETTMQPNKVSCPSSSPPLRNAPHLYLLTNMSDVPISMFGSELGDLGELGPAHGVPEHGATRLMHPPVHQQQQQHGRGATRRGGRCARAPGAGNILDGEGGDQVSSVAATGRAWEVFVVAVWGLDGLGWG